MGTQTAVPLSRFALDVREGLTSSAGKWLPSTWLYDDLGSSLFEAITVLPEYGLTRADERLLRQHSSAIASSFPSPVLVAELGSGSGRKTYHLLNALKQRHGTPAYAPIDVSVAALSVCRAALASVALVRPIHADYLYGLRRAAGLRGPDQAMLVLFLGSTIGNFDPPGAREFLCAVRKLLRPGDALLLGADLVKPVELMLVAYDDPAGVTAAFNRNLLGRMNRELGANFDLRLFRHEARYDPEQQRIEMHLRATIQHEVSIPEAGITAHFAEGETIWTESSHKYTLAGLTTLAHGCGFTESSVWTDAEWPFAECLWTV